MIHIRHHTPVEQRRTEIKTNPVISEEGHGVEFIIEQSTYKVLSRRYAPTKLILFTLSVDEAKGLAQQLLAQAERSDEHDER